MSSCVSCDENSVSTAGASSCTACDAGTVANGDSTECGKCLAVYGPYFKSYTVILIHLILSTTFCKPLH